MTTSAHTMHDLRRLGIHEFAHSIVARKLGAAGFVRFFADASAQFQLYGDLADDEWRIVALAGTIAECVDDDRELSPVQMSERLRTQAVTLSDTDARLAAGFDMHDIERCLELVRAAWHEIEAEAASMPAISAAIP